MDISDELLADLFKEVNRTEGGDSAPVQISTLTASFNLSQSVDLRLLALWLHGGCVIYDPKSTALVNSAGTAKKSFQNQASVELTLASCNRRICAAVFTNGNVKLTGCKSEEECHEAARTLISKIKLTKGTGDWGEPVFPVLAPAMLTYDPTKLELIMVKADFDFGVTLSLERTFELLKKAFDNVVFEPKVYCAIKVQVPLPSRPKGVTMCVFHTGKAFVSGRIPICEIRTAYDRVASVLAQNVAHIQAPLPVKSRRRRKPTTAPRPGNFLSVPDVPTCTKRKSPEPSELDSILEPLFATATPVMHPLSAADVASALEALTSASQYQQLWPQQQQQQQVVVDGRSWTFDSPTKRPTMSVSAASPRMAPPTPWVAPATQAA